ncbi:DUF2333 family protein [Billgrantia azerbaijanica]|nr:DUF2333 family protein [Halomonas azerbaijanica]
MASTRSADRPRSRADVLERPDYGWIWKPLAGLAGAYLVVVLVLGIWWSRSPAAFDVEQAVAEQRAAVGEPTAVAARGAVTVATLMTVVDTLLDKPGGYLRNDMAPPGVWLDNMPAWEYGVLVQARDLAAALPAMVDGEAAVLDEVRGSLQHDSRDWLYPGTEQPLAQARDALGTMLAGFTGEGPGFATDGEGLARWLERVAERLDALSQRLSASVADGEVVGLLDVEAPVDETPWYRVDDVFFEARGTGWALVQLLEGVQRDHADVIAAADASARWARLRAELERSQRRLWSPVVLNGSGFGLFANHSLVMAHYLIQARDLAVALAGALDDQAIRAQDAEAEHDVPDAATPAANDDGPSADGPSPES